MNAYRQQQLAAAALIDSGDYTAEQVAEVFGWIKPKHKPPERAAPERSEPPRTKPKRKSKLLRILCRLLK